MTKPDATASKKRKGPKLLAGVHVASKEQEIKPPQLAEEGQMAAEWHAVIQEDIAIVSKGLRDGLGRVAEDHLQSFFDNDQPYATVRQAAVCRTLLGEHPDLLIQALHSIKTCDQGYCQSGCQQLALGYFLESVFEHSSYGRELAYDYGESSLYTAVMRADAEIGANSLSADTISGRLLSMAN